MLAYTYVEQGKFALLDKPKPVLQNDRDAIVRVTLASICTSDLHIKHGGGIHHTALPLALRLHGLGLRLGLGLDFRLGCGGGGLDCRAGFHRGGGFGRFLGRLGLRLFGGGKNLLQRVDLTVLGDMVKDDVQLLVGEYLAVALGLVEILAGDF